MSGGAPAGFAEGYFAPRETPWFRARLALRLAVPLDREAKLAAWKVAWSAAFAAPPLVVALIAPTGKLTAGTVAGLCCAALPGIAATAWSAARLRETRELAGRALRQSGAEQRTAWLIAAARLALFAGFGAIGGALLVAALHVPLGALLPRRAPLHGMFGAGLSTWVSATAITAAAAMGIALTAGSTVWDRIDWQDLIRTIRKRIGDRVSALRVWRRPR
jgi:hypothetical protein